MVALGAAEGEARQCIDAGACAFVSHGAPLLHGIELYLGRLDTRACFAIPGVASVPEDQQQEVVGALLSLAEVVQGPRDDVRYGQRLKARLPAKRVPEAVERWVRYYEAERTEGEA